MTFAQCIVPSVRCTFVAKLLVLVIRLLISEDIAIMEIIIRWFVEDNVLQIREVYLDPQFLGLHFELVDKTLARLERANSLLLRRRADSDPASHGGVPIERATLRKRESIRCVDHSRTLRIDLTASHWKPDCNREFVVHIIVVRVCMCFPKLDLPTIDGTCEFEDAIAELGGQAEER